MLKPNPNFAMTEHRIFEILLKDFKIEDYEFDYPRLQKTPARFIAQKFTDIIYDTLKQKSSVSNIKRGNTVKFINSLCEVKECHGKDENYDFYFATVKKFYETAEDVDLNKLCCEAYSDLSKYVPDNFTDEVVMFQRKKYSKQMGQVRKLEFVKMMDQEEISAKFDMQVRKKFNYYETNETLIRNALGRGLDFRLKNSSLENESTDFREKQIKLAYSLLNLHKNVYLIKNILQRISTYHELKEFEINFIQYLWIIEENNSVTPDFLAATFPVLLERLILKYSTDVVLLNEEDEVEQYFMHLENDEKLKKIRGICTRNSVIYYKLKNLIYELYCYSFCNQNILRLTNFIE